MNAHIINCREDDLQNFVRNGYVGVSLVCKGTTPRQLSIACRTSYSMYSDMKTVRPGDLIFLHTEQKIYGIFEATTEFLEDPSAPPECLSPNMHYYGDPSGPGSGWENLTAIPQIGDYRRVAIKHFSRDGRNLCFEEGFEAAEVFELKRKNKIWSIPERWKYTDAARTVRPLMLNEAFELCNLLKRENSDNK